MMMTPRRPAFLLWMLFASNLGSNTVATTTAATETESGIEAMDSSNHLESSSSTNDIKSTTDAPYDTISTSRDLQAGTCEDTKGKISLSIQGKDYKLNCVKYEKKGLCDSDLVKAACPKSCGTCSTPSPTPPTSTCEDTKGKIALTLDSKSYVLTCKKYLKKELCYYTAVADACPFSCDACDDSSDDDPDSTPAPTPCADTKGKLDLVDLPNKSCAWFLKKDRCGDSGVSDACPVSCSACFASTTPAPTSSAITPAPSPSPSPGPCADATGKLTIPGQKKNKDCAWFLKKSKCGETGVSEACPVSCGACVFRGFDELAYALAIHCSGFTTEPEYTMYGPIEKWDISNVDTLSGLFILAGTLACNPDISAWDVSGVTDFAGTFHSAYTFNQDISSWDVSGSTSFTGMFWEATAFDQDLSSWSTSNSASFALMFSGAQNFNQNIGSWDVSWSTTFRSMFSGANNFNQQLQKWDVSGAWDFSQMFSSAIRFDQDISSWDVSSGQNFDYMFFNAEAFKQDLCSWNILASASTTDICTNADSCGSCV